MVGIGAAALALGGVVVRIVPALVSRDERLEPPPPRTDARAEPPIEAQAGQFRIRSSELPRRPPDAGPTAAQPRTLAIHRSLRAYPGAPPRVPHGLTNEEFQRPTCDACHERGGYSARFGTYAPITPHPELRDCLACHATDADRVGIGFPDPASREVCRQCHTLGDRTVAFAPLDWPAPDWPLTGERALPGAPPAVPHPLHFRERCLACHGGPAAVVEIRTTHPERTHCLQCHVARPFP